MEPREKAALLPESPGVYLFKDAGGTVLYVGKARNLRSRVRSYFLESRWIDAKTGSLAREIADLETIVVGNEREALALEHNLNGFQIGDLAGDRKSTRLNSSHQIISYAAFCLKKKK